jgi:hypothetical protein
MLASCQQRWSDADERFAAALALEESVGSRPLATRTRVCWARCLVDRPGPADGARGLLSQAAADATALGMHRLLDEIAALEHTLSGPGDGRSSASTVDLTTEPVNLADSAGPAVAQPAGRSAGPPSTRPSPD